MNITDTETNQCPDCAVDIDVWAEYCDACEAKHDDGDAGMSSRDLADALAELIVDNADDSDAFEGVSISTYRDAGVLTMNDGLVITLDNGDEFQVTIVRSR